ncbi:MULTISPECIES: alpha/beta hydrolase [Nocardia]|uniref:alpha/beta hydrolase n=1 Tax=Nocardia TaxID=1817 RepID=UPI000BF15FDF|nr:MULTISPECIES: alpha/beta hydrolase [Nocardia]MBF6068083.1 alpha/beta hydrolase [Nocardia farcinica]MBF6186474.1 alpha/beta hydrolase [Nocardia farcinica]MBF6254220.1 alpha/beta hydrolase [Nocardia farcinica]MBF6268180.1 alpha/beta hydrolase [Nocardia farcinica]MBF6295175.1 alpha/beta hydrolase [Nocardia farcinica]
MGLRRGCGVLVAALAVVAAGCTIERGEQAGPMPAAPAGLERFYEQAVPWGPCAGFTDDQVRLPPNAQCARIEVPVDYADPAGPTAQIALSRIPASGAKIGSLLLNPGGPGVSGLDTVAIANQTPLSERFDRVGFDPRGVGASTPAITCLTPPEADAERAERPEDNTPAGIAAAEADNRDYAAKCAQRSGAELLEHVGTREVVQDMDVIRAVLGDPKLTYLGYSYGTKLGSLYAEKFPDRVRALVLDGAVDSSQDPVQESLRQAAGFQRAFDAYAADCARTPDCPLGTDPAQAVARFRELVDPLWDRPAATTDPRGLSYNDAITGVTQTLYTDDLWQVLTLGLQELRDGRGDTLLQLADLYDGRRDDGTYRNTQDAFNAIRCVDDPRVTDPAVAARQDTEYRKAAPFLDDGRGTGAAPLELCAAWPVPNSGEPHSISVQGLPTTVVVSTTEDPATPYQAGVDLAAQLGAALVTFRGNRHTAALVAGNECLDSAVIAYLVDLTIPPAGLTC